MSKTINRLIKAIDERRTEINKTLHNFEQDHKRTKEPFTQLYYSIHTKASVLYEIECLLVNLLDEESNQ
jgi:hypothetical protein